jgi:hypothetical protein
MLGYPVGIGFAIGVLRRIKEMIWVLLGLLSLMIHRMVVQTGKGAPGASAVSAGSAIKIQRAQGEQSL